MKDDRQDRTEPENTGQGRIKPEISGQGKNEPENTGQGRIAPGDIGRDGFCQMCGEWSRELFRILAYGIDSFVCRKCRKRVQDRIRRRYLTAGEHTEPAE